MGRRRRSLHFVPGGNEKMLAKALTLPADGLILDLEDAVPPDRKVATRPVVRDWLSTREFGARERWVRMNPIWGPLGAADLAETIVARPDGYVVRSRATPPTCARSPRRSTGSSSATGSRTARPASRSSRPRRPRGS